jgi:CHAT domain-containing protein
MFKKILFLVTMMTNLFGGAAFAATSSSDYLKQSEEAVSAGRVYEAQDLLKKAEKNSNTPVERWLINIASADIMLRNGQIKGAEDRLISIYDEVQEAQNYAIISEIMQRFGHIEIARNHKQQSEGWYKQAIETAEKTGDHAQIASAVINLSKVNKDRTLVERALASIQSITDPQIKQQLQLSLGYQAAQLGELKIAQEVLQSVVDRPIISRFKAQALGYQADLYAQQQRIDEALQLIEQAQLSDSSPDLLLDWHWQKARFLLKQGKYTKALSAYRSAIQQLEQARIDIPVVYDNGESSFDKTFSPLYSEYIETLLQQTEKAELKGQQQLLNEVLQTWEQLKAEELQDYFRDACTVKQQNKSSIVEAGTAILYPIMLSDKMALLVRFEDQIKAYQINKTPAEISALVQSITSAIYSGSSLKKESNTLYQWLIAPLSADLQQKKIETLVYLPDGALRKIPFSLLFDGQQYLTEKYALVTVPGLSLVAPQSKNTQKNDILLAGMSEPGPVVEELLNSGVDLFEAPAKEKRGLPQRKLNLRQAEAIKRDRALRANRMKELLALPGVSEELKTLSALSTVDVMENKKFLLKNFINNVHQGHSIVHIASHGYFSGDPKQSFIMTYDRLLNMTQLSELFQNEAVNNRPVELVTLSACQTAEGDDRSPLGLSGVVVQTGVKSAIGTLWPVADEAAKQFFSDFYKYYQQPGVTKAMAMQQAQQSLMKNEKLNHPVYWAPFVLVGEWH